MKMKKIITLLLLFPLAGLGGLYAQKELWGVNPGDQYTVGYYGNITKSDINGENPVIIHEFDSIHGKNPLGRLFLASNGKLYGTTLYGGNVGIGGVNGVTGGVLFEYDLILNKFRVINYFDVNTIAKNPFIGVIEPIPGQLYGATTSNIYKYDIATETTTTYNSVGYRINSELMKASDGNLYTNVDYNFCTGNLPNNPPDNGSIVKFNLTTNVLSIAHPLDCSINAEGQIPFGQLVEFSPGKLLGVTKGGGYFPATNSFAYGTLFEYNFLTDVFTKKIDFDRSLMGGIPFVLLNGGNGKVIGLCEIGGRPPGNTSTDIYDFRGTLFEYNPATNAIVVKQYFVLNEENYLYYPQSLVKTSLGHYVGTHINPDPFKWNPSTNTLTSQEFIFPDIPPFNARKNINYIEICRKPSYREFPATAFTPCVNDPFTFDVQNTNATNYVWKKDNITLPAQTTRILNIASLTITDTGSYTCTMTNECGITVTMPLQINVSCLGVEEIIGTKNDITLYPNPAKTILNIKLPENKNFEVQKTTIINLLGQTIYTTTDTITTVNITPFSKGIYALILSTNKGDYTSKFIKE